MIGAAPEGHTHSSTAALNAFYPVGSIYMSVNATNPGSLFGGTWVQWGAGRVPVGINTADSSFNAAEKTGGDKFVKSEGVILGTALSQAQIPSHNHSIPALSGTAASTGASSVTLNALGERYGTTILMSGESGLFKVGNSGGTVAKVSSNSYTTTDGITADMLSMSAHSHSVSTSASTTGSVGSGQTHDHTFVGTATSVVQPYITCYMWKRTA